MQHTYYGVLGLKMTATAAEIERAYRQQALQLHPSRGNRNKALEEHLRRVEEAYSVLGDEETRRAYDAILRANASSEEMEESSLEDETEVNVFMEEMVSFTENLTNQNFSSHIIFSELVKRGCPGSVAYILADTANAHHKLAVYKAAMIAFLQAIFWIMLGGLMALTIYFLEKPVEIYLVTLAICLFLIGVFHCLRAAFYLFTSKLPTQVT
jgi:DnaJ domain